MLTIVQILLATLIDSIIGLIGIFSLWVKKKKLDRIVGLLVAFSAGALLGGAFFHLLPESVESMETMPLFGYALAGFIVFLLIEGFFHSHLCAKCKAHPFTYIMLIGDAIHNFIDGLVIAAAFCTNAMLGIVTSLMIIGHEAPQEIGLFGALVYGGHEKVKSLLYSFLAQTTVIIGGLAGYFASSQASFVSAFLVPFAAGGFIYIASADLVPEMHKMYEGDISKSAKVLSAFAAGIALMIMLKFLFGG